MDDVAQQDEVVRVLKRTLESKNMPHLLFYGPPGTGKTSTVLALARELFGPELMKRRVLELNASDDRGIRVVREKIKSFAQIAVNSETVPGHPCPPYKIIILDEADSMTTDAQAALRRTMETYSRTTRFAIICNYVSRIIEPLASRCAKFRFKPLDGPSARSRLDLVCRGEGVRIESEAVDTLLELCGGDLRRAIMCLQSGHRLFQSETMTSASVRELVGVVPDDAIESLVRTIRTQSFAHVDAAVRSLVMSGFSGFQVILQLAHVVATDASLANAERANVAVRLAQAERCLVEGADEHLQLLDVAAYWMSVARK